MAKRMSDLTNEEMNIAFDAVHDKIEALVSAFVPRFFQRQAHEAINSTDGRKALLEGIDAAADAIEEHRKKQPERKGP